MAHVKGICAGLVGPKSENVEIPLVFKGFFEASRRPRVRQPREQPSEPRDFSLKMLCGYIRNCASYAGGEHIFRKFMKKDGREMKKGAERA